MNLKIESYKPKYKNAFKIINEEWITKYFKLEAIDLKILNNPGKIIDDGGDILFVIENGKPIATCALIKMKDCIYDFELAKMGVLPKNQGKKVGWLLGRAAIERAKILGASTIYLESNTCLEPAMKLYNKLGFRLLPLSKTPYERCNIQMVLEIMTKNHP